MRQQKSYKKLMRPAGDTSYLAVLNRLQNIAERRSLRQKRRRRQFKLKTLIVIVTRGIHFSSEVRRLASTSPPMSRRIERTPPQGILARKTAKTSFKEPTPSDQQSLSSRGRLSHSSRQNNATRSRRCRWPVDCDDLRKSSRVARRFATALGARTG